MIIYAKRFHAKYAKLRKVLNQLLNSLQLVA